MRALKFITGHVIFKLCYNQIYQLKTTVMNATSEIISSHCYMMTYKLMSRDFFLHHVCNPMFTVILTILFIPKMHLHKYLAFTVTQ